MTKNQINTKSKDYLKDKEAFLKDLKQFNEGKGLTLKPAIVNGIEIDLYLFYSLVLQRGGLSKVNQTDAWDSFLRPLRLPHPCINGSTLLRKIYGTHLEKYERAKGPPSRDDDIDGDDDPRRGRGFQRVTYSGAYLAAANDQFRGNARAVAGPSERLALSLLSPMPNEQDFAVNVCTVLAADMSNRLPLSTTPHILDFLLAHAGVYNHSSLRDTIGRSYQEARGKPPDAFWSMRAGGGGAKELADENKFVAPGLEQPELMVQALAAQNTLTDRLTAGDDLDMDVEKIFAEQELLEDWVTEPSEEDQLFAPEFPGGAKCVYTQRVLQIASIVRSLSFHEDNVQYLARNTTCIRFLLLCANCWVGSLRQSGLDTLGNLCTELVIKDPATCLISRHVLSTIQSALVSDDRARVLAALEMLNKLAQNEANEEVLLKNLEARVYVDVCALLTLRDIMALVCSLECVYALTSLGERACDGVARARVLATLVALVTVEAQSYGPRACILMRVVETVSALPEPPPQQENVVQTKAVVQPPPPSPSKPPEPRPAAPASVAPPVNNLQQAHIQQKTVQENEQFALAWLRASYEPLPPTDNSCCDANDLYRQYLACCSKLMRKGVIVQSHFPRLVRTVFGGTVGPTTVTLSTGETQQMYIGIKARNQPARTTQPAAPASSILKAQLTNKPGTVEVKTVVPQVQQVSSQQPPPLIQSVDINASNTSLIKHLLANKVSPATHVQVAQRQQNQQRVGPVSANTVTLQPNQNSAEVDPEALIKCTTIIPGGAAPGIEKVIVTPGAKEEPVQIQIDEQNQLTLKTAQNKMLADLLEKKSNPPVQVVQMAAPQLNAPTIQITETGQIVQVKQEGSVMQLNPDVTPVGPFYQIKNEQGQIVQLKNDQGQIIQLKSDQITGQIIQMKNDKGQVIKSHIVKRPETEPVASDHTHTEPPSKKQKVEEKATPQESVSKTAANLYAALAASALEDEEDLVPPKPEVVDVVPQPVMVAGTSETQPVLIQEPIMQVQQQMQVQPPPLQLQQPLQVSQPMLQVQPMDVQNIIATQSGQLILQDNKTMGTQQTQYVQQPMQIIATPANTQGGISYLAQNIPGNMMQKTIIIVQGATGGGPITLTVNNPGGLDEATLNSVIAQATEAITQQQIIQNSGVIQSAQRVMVSQPTLVSTSQPMTIVKTTKHQNPPQLTQSQQPIITSQPQPHKAHIVNQNQQIMVTQKQTPTFITTSTNQVINQQMLQPNQQVIQGTQQLLQGNQQIIAMSNNQQVIVNTPMKGVHRVVQQRPQTPQAETKTAVMQGGVAQKVNQPVMRQVITRQPVMVGGQKIGEKELVISQPMPEVPQLVATSRPKTPAAPSAPSPQPVQYGPDDSPWICHWRGCGKSFSECSEVFTHAARVHATGGAADEAACHWLDCDRLPRKTFALLNHLADKHCTKEALKAVFNSRRHAATENESNKSVSVGYPPNAAMAALNKHCVEFLNPRELMDENEGPVTKSIRLTAALILRNLVIYSKTGRRLLRTYESHLATIAFSNVEASRTIAQVLHDMNNI